MLKTRFRWEWAFLILAIVLLFYPMFFEWRIKGDFEPHTAYLLRLVANEPNIYAELPNFLWHMSAGLPYTLIGGEVSMFVVWASVGWVVILGIIIYAMLWQVMVDVGGRVSQQEALLGVAVTLGALVITPLNVLTPENAYYGYLMPYVYHNPTMLPLRPIALLLFWAGVSVVVPFYPRRAWVRWGAVALLSLAGIWAKPSYAMVLLPALGVLVLWGIIRRYTLDWGMIVLGIGLPTVGLLGYQAMTYAGGGMEFAPFLTFGLWAYHYNPLAETYLLFKLGVSLLFPALIYGLYWREAWRDIAFNFAWIGMGVGLLYSYLFVDSGDRVAGNLVWNGQIAAFVLHIVAVFYLMKMRHTQPITWRARVAWGGFAVHVLSGILWAIMHYQNTYDVLVNQIW